MNIFAAISKLEHMADSTLLRLEGDYDTDLERHRFKVLKRYRNRLPIRRPRPRVAEISTPMIKKPLNVLPIIYKLRHIGKILYPNSPATS